MIQVVLYLLAAILLLADAFGVETGRVSLTLLAAVCALVAYAWPALVAAA